MPVWTERREGAVAVLSYRNPPRNFLTFAALAELGEILRQISADDAISVVVLRSEVPGYFVAHADLEELARLAAGPVPEARSWYTTMRLVETMPQPVIAAIDGQSWGGGVELALSCALRWASAAAHFALIETSLGIIPGAGGTQRLIRLLGRGDATELVLSGEVVDAERAREVGLVGRVFATENFDEAVLAAATAMARKPLTALAAAKRVLRDGAELSIADAFRLEGATFADLLATPESVALQRHARHIYANAADDEPVRFGTDRMVN